MDSDLNEHHFAIVELISQAYDWTRRFHVSTEVEGDDGDTLSLFPLRAHAEALARICGQLGGIPAEPQAGGTSYVEGQNLVLRLSPISPHLLTHQGLWRAAVDRAREHQIAAGASVEDIDSYHRGAQALFTDAFTTVRAAYADCVAATFGRHWARVSPPATSTALLSWVKALADAGFSLQECEAVLQSMQDADPESVAKCRAHQQMWFITPVPD